MANGRNGRRRIDEGRDTGRFMAIPVAVLDCPAYLQLGHPARSLLVEIARQFVRDNNGQLLASGAFLSKRGWKSNDVITRALRELMAAGFIHQTVLGHRPNKASWYAVTWRTLDRHPGYDHGAVETFRRSAYLLGDPSKNASPTPSHGAAKNAIAPSRGVGKHQATPSHGAIRANSSMRPAPSDGDHLEKPSAVVH